MHLTDYVRILLRRGWIVIVAVILTAGSAFFFSKLQTPVYRATQKILIAPARNDFGLAQVLKQLMSSWAERLNAEERAAEVIELLNLDMTPRDLKERVTASTDLNTLLINIDVDMTDGALANRIANMYGQQFRLWREEQNAPLRLEDRINAELLDYPSYGQFRPNTAVNVAAGALLGMILGGAVVFVLESLDANIIRRPDDVERYLELPVLGTLPHTD